MTWEGRKDGKVLKWQGEKIVRWQGRRVGGSSEVVNWKRWESSEVET